MQGIISYANNTDVPIDEVIIAKYPYFELLTSQIKRVDYIYQQRKRERNVMDYDDLLLNLKKLLLEKPDIANLYAEQFQHILVDEYQDTNRLQAELIDLLAVKHRNVMVVGDDAQSIFAWRGAEFTNIYEFPKRYPEANVFKLETNYRSTPEILALANVSIANNKKQFPKRLTAVKRSQGIKPALVRRDVPVALPFDRAAIGIVTAKYPLPRPIRRSLFRAGPHQGRSFLPERDRKSARRAGMETHPENDPGNRKGDSEPDIRVDCPTRRGQVRTACVSGRRERDRR